MNLDLQQIAVAVEACDTVAGLHSGDLGTIASDLGPGRLIGLVYDGRTLTVGVVGRYPATVAEISADVRAAVAQHIPGMPVLVSVEDLYVPSDIIGPESEYAGDELPPDEAGGRHRAPE